MCAVVVFRVALLAAVVLQVRADAVGHEAFGQLLVPDRLVVERIGRDGVQALWAQVRPANPEPPVHHAEPLDRDPGARGAEAREHLQLLFIGARQRGDESSS